MTIFRDAYDYAVSHGAKGVVMILADKQFKYNSQYGVYDGRNHDLNR